MPISTVLVKIRFTMLCLSGFQLYSRWVPLSIVSRQEFTLDLGSNIQVTIKDTLIPVHHQPLMSAETPTTKVSQLLLISSYCNGASGPVVSGILLTATVTASFMYLFGYSVGYIG